MPVAPTYPGLYIEEIPSGVRTITGAATSVTAFVGSAPKGETDAPVRVTSFGDFERKFGGLSYGHPLTYSVYHFFQNGGGTALIVRVAAADATTALYQLPAGGGTFDLDAASPGTWGNHFQIYVDHDTADESSTSQFNLRIDEVDDEGNILRSETWRNLVFDESSSSYVVRVLELSDLVRVHDPAALSPSDPRPDENPAGSDGKATPYTVTTAAVDGSGVTAAEYEGSRNDKTGIYALEDADIFNLLVLPSISRAGDATAYPSYWSVAKAYCLERRAVLLVDPLSAWDSYDDVEAALGNPASGLPDLMGTGNKNVAVYFPRFYAPDPLLNGAIDEFAPAGAVAGVISRTDSNRGVWKAPAGLEANMVGTRGLTVPMTDDENGVLNQLGVNCLRTFPIHGTVVWGARTGEGADRVGSEWKYLPVRRTALFIEETLYRNLRWVVFEPNDEPLWSQIRLNVGAFMQTLFRQGAFQGSKPSDAYLVKCDSETTTQDDINRGIVNILVGFAPLKPAEFVMIKLQQLAGQTSA